MRPHTDPERLRSFDALPEEQRRTLLPHLRECASCRERWAAEDSSRLFSLLTLDAVPHSVLEQLSERVERALPQARAVRPIYAVAGLAASLVLASLIGWYASSFRHGGPATAPKGRIVDVQSVLEASAPVRGIELLSSPGNAQVVGLDLGDTQVVMIFDEEMGI